MKFKHFGMGFAICALLLAQAGLASAQNQPAGNPSFQCDCPVCGPQGPMAGSRLSDEELAQLKAQASEMQQKLQPLQDKLFAANLRLDVLRSAPDVTTAQLNALVDEIVSLQGQISQIVSEYEAQLGDKMPMRTRLFMFDHNMQGGGMQQFRMNQSPMPNPMPGQMPGQMGQGGMHHRYVR